MIIRNDHSKASTMIILRPKRSRLHDDHPQTAKPETRNNEAVLLDDHGPFSKTHLVLLLTMAIGLSQRHASWCVP